MTQNNSCEGGLVITEYTLYLFGAAFLIFSYTPEILILLILNIYQEMEGNQKTTMDLYLSQLDVVRELFLVTVGIAVYAAKVKRKASSQWFGGVTVLYFGLMVWLYAKIYCLVS